MDLKELVENEPETELAYLTVSYARTISSNVAKVVVDNKRSIYFLLDRTIFHPKSGGQPSDTGKLTGGNFEVDVRKTMMFRGRVVHWARTVNGQPEPGPANCEIDWESRFLYMRRHSAAHLLDHCLSQVTGRNVETVDSWVGDDSYVGYSGQRPEDSQLRAAEIMENEMIAGGSKILISEASKKELTRIAPNAPNIYRLPDLEKLRIVTIEGCGPIPCGGTHTRDISEIKAFKLLRADQVSSGFRVYFAVN